MIGREFCSAQLAARAVGYLSDRNFFAHNPISDDAKYFKSLQ
jgi:hypothetical protein